MDDEATYDLLVIGGGVNGAAIARDAALRGLSVCLVEMHDWGWGTSAKSSKLAHGGLRYLEQFEFGLVHEALSERERFFRHAPHLVQPLPFLYPIYPHVAARRTVRLGLLLYDVLSLRKSVPRRGYLSRDRALQAAPGLNPEGLRGAATYYDGQVRHVERLVWEMVEDARRNGATVLPRTAVEYLDFERQDGRLRVVGATVTPTTGDAAPRRIRAHATVNATGCWVDDVLGPLAQGKAPKVRKTKGIHIVVPGFTRAAFLIRSRDGRVVFILPWEGQCVIGTTDTDYEGDAGDAQATAGEIAYLQAQVRPYFPEAPLEDVRFTYAGVRALVNQPGVTESNVTRRHILYDHAARDGCDGLWTLQGGKITTARALAEEAVDHVAKALGRRDAARAHPTRDRPYPGGPPSGGAAWSAIRPGLVHDLEALGFDAAAAANLADTYGTQAPLVAACDARPQARQRLSAERPETFVQVAWAVRREQATTLADVMLRRTMAGLAPGGNLAGAQAALDWMGDDLRLDAAQRAALWQDYLGELRVLAVPTLAAAAAPAVATSR